MNGQRVPAARRAAGAADRRRQSPNNATRSARRLTPAFEKIDSIWLRTALMHTPLYLSVLDGCQVARESGRDGYFRTLERERTLVCIRSLDAMTLTR
ncbi:MULTISPECIES: hypothetical protein [Burkholderia]|uniref:hypothetical protein n=1 Tax=Burkholderia TaxID=32008 RepID=UPI001583143C|nr:MULTISPECIES: hypothetical protein [Burkholderia]